MACNREKLCCKRYRQLASQKRRVFVCLEGREVRKVYKSCTVMERGKVGIKEESKQPKLAIYGWREGEKKSLVRTQCKRDSSLFIIFQGNRHDGIMISN